MLFRSPGMLSAAEISDILGQPVTVMRQDFPAETRAPGMHHLHYSPVTPTELLTAQQLQNLTVAAGRAVCLTLSAINIPVSEQLQQIQMPANAVDYAHALYATLRAQDQNQYQRIYVETLPETAEWDAIRDRLTKACGNL